MSFSSRGARSALVQLILRQKRYLINIYYLAPNMRKNEPPLYQSRPKTLQLHPAISAEYRPFIRPYPTSLELRSFSPTAFSPEAQASNPTQQAFLLHLSQHLILKLATNLRLQDGGSVCSNCARKAQDALAIENAFPEEYTTKKALAA